jgi:hypothetical protein
LTVSEFFAAPWTFGGFWRSPQQELSDLFDRLAEA